jgi:hypothetical protein
MKRLDAAGVVDEVTSRLARLTAETSRQWGTMTAHEMVCHLTDSYRIATGERAASAVDTWMSRSVVRWIALHTSLPWPRGVPTRPEVDPKRDGTRPSPEFLRDRDALAQLIASFAAPLEHYARHPIFGSLTRDEWMVWGYRHADHHLRQFGL